MKKNTLILTLILLLNAGPVFCSPTIKEIRGVIQHGKSVLLKGENFGEKSKPRPVLWDTIDNIPAYSGLEDGDIIPIGEGYPWAFNGGHYIPTPDTPNNPIRYSTSREQRTIFSKAQYSTHTDNVGGSVGNLEVEGPNLFYSWWWKPNVKWNLEPPEYGVEYTQSNKITRAGDFIPFPGNLIFSWNWSSQYASDKVTGLSNFLNWKSWDDYFGKVGEWNRQDVFFDNVNRVAKMYTNNHLVSEGDFSSCPWDFLAIRQIGLNPNGPVPGLIFDLSDIYVDNTAARVEVCEKPEFFGGNHCEIQIAKIWNDNTIELVFNQGSFEPNSEAYFFIVDQNGIPSKGYRIVVNAPLPPTGVTVVGSME